MARRAIAVAQLVAVASCTDSSDVVSMIQHGAKAGEPEYEIAMQNWLGQFYSLIKSQQDPVLASCCSLAKKRHMTPHYTWGEATEEEKTWWNDVDCNTAVGALNAEEPNGTPNCETMSMLTNLVPKDQRKEPMELYSAESGCSEEDRASINSTFLGTMEKDSVDMALPMECAPSRLIEKSAVKWDVLSMCVRRILSVSETCSDCYSSFMRAVGGNTRSDDSGCMKTCYGLEACASLYYCAKQSTWCTTCIQPALNKYVQCIGGPVENQLNMEDVMRKMVHVWGTLGNLVKNANAH